MGIASKVYNLVHFLRGQGVEVESATWEREYAGGDWAYLHGLEQMPRYALLVQYIHYARPGGSVLDLGCGEGILEQMLAPYGYGRYLGVDLSEKALEQARARAAGTARFEVQDARTWEPSEPFDLIVFNEALYYFKDPVAILRKFERSLTPRGLFLISMFSRAGHTRPIWARVSRAYPVLHQTDLRTGRGGRWSVRLVGRPGMTLENALGQG